LVLAGNNDVAKHALILALGTEKTHIQKTTSQDQLLTAATKFPTDAQRLHYADVKLLTSVMKLSTTVMKLSAVSKCIVGNLVVIKSN
jgi:hypothetical protein